jgi:hypothetical protein
MATMTNLTAGATGLLKCEPYERQGDQIGRIFAQRAITYKLWAGILKITEIAHILATFFPD